MIICKTCDKPLAVCTHKMDARESLRRLNQRSIEIYKGHQKRLAFNTRIVANPKDRAEFNLTITRKAQSVIDNA